MTCRSSGACLLLSRSMLFAPSATTPSWSYAASSARAIRALRRWPKFTPKSGGLPWRRAGSSCRTAQVGAQVHPREALHILLGFSHPYVRQPQVATRLGQQLQVAAVFRMRKTIARSAWTPSHSWAGVQHPGRYLPGSCSTRTFLLLPSITRCMHARAPSPCFPASVTRCMHACMHIYPYHHHHHHHHQTSHTSHGLMTGTLPYPHIIPTLIYAYIFRIYTVVTGNSVNFK